uniref:Uncharacterized protein n=1 Tax=Rhizophora mucronata TaxID=61149 RepID=A0A2P2MT55_RHIMU
MVLLTLSVSVVPLNQREVVFFIALYVLSIGGGGFRPCVQPFAADQFDERKPEEVEAKNSFFNWWYVAIMGGMCFSTMVVITLQMGRYYDYHMSVLPSF